MSIYIYIYIYSDIIYTKKTFSQHDTKDFNYHGTAPRYTYTLEATAVRRIQQPAGHDHVARAQQSSPQATSCFANTTPQPAGRTMLRGRNHAARKPHHVARTQPRSPQAAPCCVHATQTQPMDHISLRARNSIRCCVPLPIKITFSLYLHICMYLYTYRYQTYTLIDISGKKALYIFIYYRFVWLKDILYILYFYIILSGSPNLACSRRENHKGTRNRLPLSRNNQARTWL